VAFWLLVPFPFWLLVYGFTGEFVFLPDTWDLLGILWLVTFCAPIILIALVAVDVVRSKRSEHDESIDS